LTVRDNGRGFDPQGRPVLGRGLELVSALAGQLNGNRTPGLDCAFLEFVPHSIQGIVC
jgi:two-component sensor histidine kinase